MSYGSTVTTKNLLGGRWLIRISETGAQSSSALVFTLADPAGDASAEAIPFTKFELVQVETILTAGDAATVQPKLQRYLEDGTTIRTMFSAPSAIAEMVYLFDPPLLFSTAKLKHFSRPSAGTNNACWTEYIIRKVE